jgi:hypothetical protein
MRKTRSRHNQAPIKVEAEHKDEDNLVSAPTAKKRRKRKTEPEKEASDSPATICQVSSISGNINVSNDINEENFLASRKSPKNPVKRLKPRKVSLNSKKEFSKSNFSMTKILQNNSPKDLDSHKGN